jgi:hypothetical protein
VRRRIALSVAAFALLAPSRALALDIGKVAAKAISIEVTEVSIVAQRFDSRTQDPVIEGGGWGQWLNRLEAKVDWNHFEVGARLDSVLYWNTLKQQCETPDQVLDPLDINPLTNKPATCHDLVSKIARDDLQRYQNSIYPAKLWASYKYKGIELILGDAYVQFARGLLLSMRKLDDLGVDNTVRGFKGSITKGPFSFTLVGGIANPSRVDEATGQSLFVQKQVPQMNPAFTNRGPQPIYGTDQIFGAEIQAGREKPIVLTTSMSYVNRCAPSTYTGPASAAPGRILNQDFASNLVGYCDDVSVATWLNSLPSVGNTRHSRHISMVAQAFEVPKLGKFGSIYVVGVIQQRDAADPTNPVNYDQGTAIYATYTGSIGKKVTNTVEFKDYRNFFPTLASVDDSQAAAFNTLQYSTPPTIESITQDNFGTGNFNVCVDGVRVRTDVRMNDALLLYGQAIATQSRSEQTADCKPTSSGPPPVDYIADGLAGFQWDFDKKQSHLYATIGARGDWLDDGNWTPFIYQGEITYNFSKAITKKVALEFLGRHRVRYEKGYNLGGGGFSVPWVEGENYTGLSIAPHFVITQGIEYTTKDLPPSVTFAGINDYPAWLFLSLGGVYKITKNSNIKLFAGQQRGGLKCISGVCRIFPNFEGARMELTVRF